MPASLSDTETTTITVNNVAPQVSGVAITTPIFENGTATLTGTITDPGTQDTFTLVVNWGEGAPQTYNLAAGATSFSVTHQYLDDNPTGTSSDTLRGQPDADRRRHRLGHGFDEPRRQQRCPGPDRGRPPGFDQRERQRDAARHLHRPRHARHVHVHRQLGRGRVRCLSAGRACDLHGEPPVPRRQPDATAFDDYPVSWTVTDDDGGADGDTGEVTVNNVAPTVIAGLATGSADEGSDFTRSGSFTDPGTLDTWTATVNFGDGTGVQALTLSPAKTFNISHVYADNGTYTVTVVVSDDDLGSGSDTITVTIENVAPTVDAGPDRPQTRATSSASPRRASPTRAPWTPTPPRSTGVTAACSTPAR